MEKKRPVGIALCAAIAILVGLLHFGSIIWSSYSAYTDRSVVVPAPVFKISLVNILWLLLPILYITSGRFLLLLKRWAWLLTLILTIVYFIDSMITLMPFTASLAITLNRYKDSLFDHSIILVMFLFTIIVYLLLLSMIIYLIHPKIRTQYK